MKLPYRSEIDGLRTIAVLSVILYHAQIVVFGHDFFKGGFVGVDIFFVISGYLISRILLSELFEKGKISFLQFYERRARRILPILFTVFIVSFPLAYKYLLPNQFIEYAQSILSATFFGSNIFFYFTNTQYGAEDSLLQPFLHTWSLGVEEQFYILFPIVLLLAYKFAKNHLVTIIAVLILISLQYADWQSTKNTQLNFFMLTSRLWELGIGSLLAFYELKYGRVKHELLNQTMPLLGLAMIGHAIVFFNNQTPHPSFITLLPTLGTALIILYSVNTTDLVGKVFSWKPIVGVGLISYSMYLWHYPLFAFARIADTNGLHNNEKIWLILFTFVLSIVSYFLIEKPFRNKQFINVKKFSVAILLLLIAVLGMNWKVIETKGFEERLPIFLKNIITSKTNWRNSFPCIDSKNICPIKGNGDKKVLFISDSIGGVYASELIKNKRLYISFVPIIKAHCPFILNESRTDNKWSCDAEGNKVLRDYLSKNEFDIIIYGGRYSYYFSKRHFVSKNDKLLENFKKTFDLLSSKTNKLIFLAEQSEYVDEKTDIKSDLMLKTKYFWNITDKDLEELNISYSKKIKMKQNKEMYELMKSYSDAIIFNLDDILCIDGNCQAFINNELIYYDRHHLTQFGARIVSKKLEKLF